MTGGGGGSCNTTTDGACEVQTCTSGTPTDGGVSVTYTDAGPVTVSGVQVNDGTMTLTPGAYGYQTVSGAVALFNAGDSVRLVAPGNPQGAPAFDVSLVAPSSVNVTAPVFNQGMVTAAAAHDLAVHWTGSSTADVKVQLAGGSGGTSVLARCAFAGNAGSGTVPAAALAAVAAAGGYASIVITSESDATRTPDGWNLAFALSTNAIQPMGLASGTLQIQ